MKIAVIYYVSDVPFRKYKNAVWLLDVIGCCWVGWLVWSGLADGGEFGARTVRLVRLGCLVVPLLCTNNRIGD